MNKPTDRAPSLIHVTKGDTVIVLKIPGVLLFHEDVLALLRSHSLPCDGTYAAESAFGIHICHRDDESETYIYLIPTVNKSGPRLNSEQARMQCVVSGAYPEAEAIMLMVTQVVDGASAKQLADWHYIVETDVQPEAEGDFNNWYEQEHLPGLAAVPGTVRALRLLNLAGLPRYHALYLLENRAVFGSGPWVKVRATDWSSRVRPSFINTKRTMFEIQSGL